jgi:hypothetical protein
VEASVSDHRSQCERILELLRRADGEWVGAPTLALVSIQYSSRLWTIRHRWGIAVENKVETVNGTKCGWFRIVPEAEKRAMAALVPAPEPESKPDATLFDLGKRSIQHRDDG